MEEEITEYFHKNELRSRIRLMYVDNRVPESMGMWIAIKNSETGC